jgi:pimeloyl-ACP methyl ester carboxylesterase
MIRFRRYAAVLVLTVLATSACSADPPEAPLLPTGSPRPAATAAQPGLQACPGLAGFSCGKLEVPVDRADPARGKLALKVAVADNADAPKGVLVLLTGGPGQPGVALLPKVRDRISYLLKDYRLVMYDQRGTGGTALNCPRLQSEVGSSDITPASEQAVQECVAAIGPDLAHYTTADTVADLEDLRTWLKAETWTLDGISYGTYVAQRYAYKYPQRVARMVLDSVVPVQGVPALYLDSLHRTAAVLRDACAATHCPGDPAEDVAAIVAKRHNGVALFDFLVTATIVDPSFDGGSYYRVLDLVRGAASGNTEPLDDAIADLRRDSDPGVELYSSGLHLATLCPELSGAPWGSSASAPSARSAAVNHARSTVDAAVAYPFDAATAVGQGVVGSCRYWPSVPPAPAVSGKLSMPVLLLNGERDLSTPLPWAVASQQNYTKATLVQVPDMGHSIQGRNAAGDAAVKDFLLG